MKAGESREHNENEEIMNVYEVGYHLLPALTDEVVATEVGALKAALGEAQAAIVSEGYPELVELSYTISKKIQGKRFDANQAFFGWVKFEANASSIKQIDSYLSGKENILRFIIVKTIKENTMLSSKLEMTAKKESEDIQASQDDDSGEKAEPASPEEIDKSIDALVIS